MASKQTISIGVIIGILLSFFGTGGYGNIFGIFQGIFGNIFDEWRYDSYYADSCIYQNNTFSNYNLNTTWIPWLNRSEYIPFSYKLLSGSVNDTHYIDRQFMRFIPERDWIINWLSNSFTYLITLDFKNAYYQFVQFSITYSIQWGHPFMPLMVFNYINGGYDIVGLNKNENTSTEYEKIDNAYYYRCYSKTFIKLNPLILDNITLLLIYNHPINVGNINNMGLFVDAIGLYNKTR